MSEPERGGIAATEPEKRGPGRPRKEPELQQAATVADDRPSGTTPDPKSDPDGYREYVARLRSNRKPFGAFTQKLAYPAREGYFRCWINDEPGRINQLRDAGYEHVRPAVGEHEKRVVGTRKEGGALFAYLMEIPTEIWEDDQRMTNTRTDKIEAAIKSSKVIAQTSTDAKEDEGNFYVPGGGSKVEQGVGRRRQ